MTKRMKNAMIYIADLILGSWRGVYTIGAGLYMLIYGERIAQDMRDSYNEAMMKFYGEQEGVQQVKIAEFNDKAYWVLGNVLYQADISDGEIQNSTQEPFNAIDAPLAQVAELMEVLDKLKDDEET